MSSERLAHNRLAGRGQVRRVPLSFGAAPGGLCAFVERDGILQCLPFDQFTWQEHGFGTRRASPWLSRALVSKPDGAATVSLRQIHSANVLTADTLCDREAEGDALVTDIIGRAVAVRTADCVPILLLDAQARAVAAIHAGWRGTAAQIISNVIEKLRRDYGTNPAGLHAAVGPCVRACCYEVSSAVAAHFEQWPASIRTQSAAKPHVDLAEANRAQMIEAGLPESHIYDSAFCTACHPDRFFSYRREPENPGRMLSAIVRTA